MPYIPDHIMKWLGPGVIIAIGFIVIFDLPIGHATLCEPEKNCLISWMGALSGWAAAIAALFTIRAMLRTQRENVDIQLHPGVTLARIVKRRASADQKRLARLESLKNLSGDQAVALTPEQSKDFRKLRRSFNQDDFDDFERIEFVGATYLSSVRISLNNVVKALNLYRGDPDGNSRKNILWPKDFQMVAGALARAEEHNARLRKASNEFTQRWRQKGVSF